MVLEKLAEGRDRIKVGFDVQQNTWNGGTKYTIASCYKWLLGEHAIVPWVSYVWNKFKVPKFSFLAWMATQEKLQALDRMQHMIRLSLVNRCYLCEQAAESMSHMFFNCRYTVEKCLIDPFTTAVTYDVLAFAGKKLQNF